MDDENFEDEKGFRLPKRIEAALAEFEAVAHHEIEWAQDVPMLKSMINFAKARVLNRLRAGDPFDLIIRELKTAMESFPHYRREKRISSNPIRVYRRTDVER
jgi:hypothetical protein